jgi:hypothetical protein
MRRLVAIVATVVLLAALAWSGWWVVQARARDRALTAWLAERRAAGWVAEAEDVRVRGFPSRVDSIVTGLSLADPAAGWSWAADEFQVLSLSYRPWHVIAVLPGQQVVATPFDTLHLTSEALRGSVIFRPSPRLELDHMTFEIGEMGIVSDAGWTAGIGEAILATRAAADGTPFAHDLAFNAERLSVPRLAAGAAGVLPETIGSISLDATLAFDRPWDRTSVEGDNPALEGVTVRDLALTWGKLDLRGRGTLAVDAGGFAEGRLDLRARNWREMLDIAERAGALDPTLAGAMRAGLGLIARLAGDRNAIDVPLDFAGGQTRLGPIVLGPAPVLARRG